MPSDKFDRSITVARPIGECWEVLTDVQRVAGWVDVVNEVAEVAPMERYDAVLTDSFGPFNLHADVAVDVIDVEDGRSIRFKGSGKDRQVNTSITVEATLDLSEEGGGTVVHAYGSWHVLGTVATMGGGTIRKKADKIVDEFFAAAEAALA
jgi:carbon monoxide dehydrogenase subunit G